jgi:hypothetical protein
MLDWLKRQGSPAHPPRETVSEPAPPQGRAMTGKYLLLYKYLQNRYANTIVLTFAEIEDLLGFTLPDQARLDRAWWTAVPVDVTESGYSDSWVLARRTAVPNLPARTVTFERAA